MQRGGLDPEHAYSIRNIIASEGADGELHLNLESYAADAAAAGTPPVPIAGTLSIPRQIGDFTIDAIGDHAFENCTEPQEVLLSDTVETIGKRAFYGCRNLTRISIPDAILHIGTQAFEGTGLSPDASSREPVQIMKDILVKASPGLKGAYTVPPHVSTIADRAFEGCGLTSLTLPESVRTLATSCLRGTQLREITIPRSVETVRTWAFSNCDKLERITFLGDTQVAWPAITGRRDGKPMKIVAPRGSCPYNYAVQYAEEYHLVPVAL